jgi:hypothetical protein
LVARSQKLLQSLRTINSTGAMRPFGDIVDHVLHFLGRTLAHQNMRPSGGGLPAAAVLARKGGEERKSNITPITAR